MDIASLLTPDTFNGILSFAFVGLLIAGAGIYFGLLLQQLQPPVKPVTLTSPSALNEQADA